MSALKQIADHLVASFRPLEQALEDPGHFRALMLSLGWRASTIPPEWTALGAAISNLANEVSALADDPTLEETIGAVTAAADLRSRLAALSTAPPGIDTNELLGETRELLIQKLVIDELARNAPKTYGLLSAFGIIVAELVAKTADRPVHTRYRFDTSKLVALIHDPKSFAQTLFAWGLTAFDADWLTELLLDLIVRIGLPARLEHSDGTFPGYPSLPIGQASIRVPLLDLVLEGSPFRLGIAIAIVPPEVGGPGLVIAPWIPGLTDSALELGSVITLKVVSGSGGPIELALVVSPAGFNLEFPGSGGALPDGGIGVEVALAIPGRVGSASGTRFELAGLTLGLYADHDADGYFARLAAHLDGATAVVASHDQDSIIGQLLGDRELKIPFPLGVSWSSRQGFELVLGPGTLGVPGSLSIGPLRFDNLALALSADDHAIDATASARVTTSLGPVTIVLDRIGGELKLDRTHPGSLGIGSLHGGVALPTGAGIVIATSIVTGGGQIDRDPATGRYSGALELAMFKYQLIAAAVLDTRTPEGRDLLSFVALAAVRFPGIPITMGFMLDGLGGLVGIHRRVDDLKLADAMRAGKLADLLLPDDPKLGLANLLAQLGTLFPVAEGRFVAGPSARIGWGTPRMLAADVMVLVELPSPVRIVMLASAAVGLPSLDKRVIDIRIDAVGVLDLDRGTISLDASLHDSKLAGYTLTGDLALRACVLSPRSLLLSIGGFHPRFTPPTTFPTLRRVELVAGDNPQLRMSAYLAKTPNSVQIGAEVDLTASGGDFDIKAHLGFDALFELHPFFFDVEIAASADVSWHGHHLLGLDLDFNLTGPHPYHAKGHASFSVLWWDVSVSFDRTWGDDSPEPALPAPDVDAILLDALRADEAWTPELPAGESSWLALRDGAGGVHPFASLVVVQRAVPLDKDISMFGAVPIPTRHFAIAHVTVATPTQTQPLAATPIEEPFAPGQFTKLSADDQLMAPSFESFHAGVRFGDAVVTVGDTASSPLALDTIPIDPLAPPPHPSPAFLVTGTFTVFAAAVRPTSEPVRAHVVAPALRDLVYTVTSTQALTSTGASGTYASMKDAIRKSADLQVVPLAHAG